MLPPDYLSNMYISYFYGSLIHCGAEWKEFDTICTYSKFYYILSGECVIEIEGTTYHAEAGMLFLIPSGVRHSFYHINENYIQKYWFHFEVESGGRRFFDLFQFPYVINTGDPRFLKKLFGDILHDSVSSDVTALLRLKARILELISYYFQNSGVEYAVYTTDREQDFERVLLYIREHIAHTVTTAELAEIMHVHPNYFIRLFKEKMGISPSKYINRMRMELAKSMLENTQIPIRTIMERIGFEDVSHFSNFFKKHSGYSPKTFREFYGQSK